MFKLIQKEYFSGIKDEKISSLCPFGDSDGLVRIKTKLKERPDSKNFNIPILLTGNHSVVHGYIKYKHEENSHVGVQGLMSLLREDVWILSGIRTVKLIKTTASYVRDIVLKVWIPSRYPFLHIECEKLVLLKSAEWF